MAKTCLYHQDFPKGKIFEDEEEPSLLLQGWVDAEWKVKAGPLQGEQPNQDDPQSEKLKPWQKAQAARKAKKKLLEAGK